MSTTTAPTSNEAPTETAAASPGTPGKTEHPTDAAAASASTTQTETSSPPTTATPSRTSLDLMIDLETLSTAKNAVVLSAGLVHFNPRAVPGTFGKEWHKAINVDEQAGGQVSITTVLDFWFKNLLAVEAMFALRLDEQASVRDLWFQINNWSMCNPDGCIWANSPGFDLDILRNLFERKVLPVPWTFWQERDVRTIRKSFDVLYPGKIAEDWGVAHDALYDAKVQAYNIQSVLHIPTS